ncbi:MAG: hypothetical protein V4627_08555 [Pseudomonadota bacterium]
MHIFLQTYFWLMAVYLAVAAMAMFFKPRKSGSPRISPAMWAEQVVSYGFLIVGLVGTYGYLHAVPFGVASFWQVFLVVFGLFVALQHFMPKTQLLLKTHGAKAVAIAGVVGVLLLAPMFVAVGIYGFSSAALWV